MAIEYKVHTKVGRMEIIYIFLFIVDSNIIFEIQIYFV